MKTVQVSSLSLAAAAVAAEAAQAKATALGMAIAVTVVDHAGLTKLFARMDGAPLLASDASRKKARTAVGFGLATGAPWRAFMGDDPILNGGVDALEDFILLSGGSPIFVDGAMVGAVGVAGGHHEQDALCTEAALHALEQMA